MSTPSQRLEALEREADHRAQAALSVALATGATGTALLVASPGVALALTGAAGAAATVGVVIALLGSNHDPKHPMIRPIREAWRRPDLIANDVTHLLLDAADRLDTATDPAQALSHTRARIRRLGIWHIHAAASEATWETALAFGITLRWAARPGACRVCAALDGTRIDPGDRFPWPNRAGLPRRPWRGYTGLPPAHPGGCRCKATPDAGGPR